MGEVITLDKLKFLRVSEIAAVLTVSKMTVYRLINSGELEAVRFGRTFRVSEESFLKYLERAKVAPGTLQWAEQITDDEANIPTEDD